MPTPSLRLFNLRHDFPTQWSRFLNPANPANGNVFELEMSPDLFRMLDAGKKLQVNTIHLLARCSAAGPYAVVLSPPLSAPQAGSNNMTLTRGSAYGGLHFARSDVAGEGITIAPTGPARHLAGSSSPDPAGTCRMMKSRT